MTPARKQEMLTDLLRAAQELAPPLIWAVESERKARR